MTTYATEQLNHYRDEADRAAAAFDRSAALLDRHIFAAQHYHPNDCLTCHGSLWVHPCEEWYSSCAEFQDEEGMVCTGVQRCPSCMNSVMFVFPTNAYEWAFTNIDPNRDRTDYRTPDGEERAAALHKANARLRERALERTVKPDPSLAKAKARAKAAYASKNINTRDQVVKDEFDIDRVSRGGSW